MPDPTTTPAPDSHEAKMVAVFEAHQAGAAAAAAASADAPAVPPTPERPAWLPEKFKTAEDMAKAYAELEKKQGGGSETPVPEQPAATPPKEGEPAPTEGAAEALQERGLNLTEFQAEFAQNQALSDASYEKLAKAGLPREVVDSYIEGQKARADVVRSAALADIGGEEQFTRMVSWAAANVPKAEIDAYNAAIDSGDLAKVKLAVAGMNARYVASAGSPPKLVQGDLNTASEVFRSRAEVTTAMRDPRYTTDPAYRADVYKKLARSNI